MIRTSLEFIKKELEAFIVEREQDPVNYNTGKVVDLKPIVLPNGNINITDTTHITIMLTGLEEERREGKRPQFIPADDKNFLKLFPPVELNLFVLFAAHNSNYETSLRDLSDVIAFFQANPVFDEQKYPALNATVENPSNKPWQLIEKLSFRLHSLTFEQQNNIWAMLGAKYIPSVVYKVNLLTFFETKSKAKEPAISELTILET
jgi:hypothetical protein